MLSLFLSLLLSLLPVPMNLDGSWEYGYGRNYESVGIVPGLHVDPTVPGPDSLWYRRSVVLPEGDWTKAELELKGARFRPAVYVNGTLVSRQNGGMIRSFHELDSPAVKPGATIILEIALASLKDVPEEDASYIPKADQWRSSCASNLWDDVVLHFNSGAMTDRVLTWCDSGKRKATLKYRVRGSAASSARLTFRKGDRTVLELSGSGSEGEHSLDVSYAGVLEEWSPDSPICYNLTVELDDASGNAVDRYEQTVGLKDFKVVGKQFSLNGKPLKLRGGTVVWHRWMRDPEGRQVGWDSDWIEKNIVCRLKDHGANYFRFHLGVPPERILDLCDRYGLAVQYEWNFFHGMPASYESLVEEYAKWLDMASRHPSVTLYHPYNETEGDQLNTVWKAFDTILPAYPQIVMEARDVIHVHKYWWSLFENLGLYYDSADQFEKAIMVDEFGGNYLDGNGDMGLYPSIRESYMRFLGPHHDAAMRYAHLDRACAKVAEYWRRIGAAGVAPFVIASSLEDGCTWFKGPLRDGNPKSVWDALTVLWSPQAVSMDVWDCDYMPGQEVKIPLHWFNDTDSPASLVGKLTLLDGKGAACRSLDISCKVPAYGHEITDAVLRMPDIEGNYKFRAELLDAPATVKSRVLSDWDVRILKAKVPDNLRTAGIYIPSNETELISFATSHGLKLCRNIRKADIILAGAQNWPLPASLSKKLAAATKRGTSVILLDAGEKYLGQGYPEKKGELGNLQGIDKLKEPRVTHYDLFRGLKMTCKEMPEPESHIHPCEGNRELWGDMPFDRTSLWNGLRGGLIVPAADMQMDGLSADAYLRQWLSCGADESRIKGSGYYAYDLCGYYEFADSADDKAVMQKLRKRVQFLIDDAPALAIALNSKAPIRVEDLCNGYRDALNGEARSFTPLACAGKNLTRTPVVKIGFGEGEGNVVISQLITAGRLASEDSQEFYGLRHDEAAVQLVLNLLSENLK